MSIYGSICYQRAKYEGHIIIWAKLVKKTLFYAFLLCVINGIIWVKYKYYLLNDIYRIHSSVKRCKQAHDLADFLLLQMYSDVGSLNM